MGIIEYADDIKCQMFYGKSALGHRNGLSIKIYGDKAAAEWVQTNPEELYIAYKNGDKTIVDRASKVSVADGDRYNRFKPGHPAGFMEAFANLYMDIADCLDQYKQTGSYSSPYVYGVDHALDGMRLLQAINESAASGQWVDIK